MCILAAAQSQTYQLVWSDEFNGNSLDLSKWQYEVNCDGGGNNEMQCYTSNPSNVRVSNGSLLITAIPQNYNGRQYTSGRINTKASAAWKYGKIEFRAQVPTGIYLWPALWMMPRDSVYGMWAASGEIDIMENRGLSNQCESTLHHGGGWPNNIWTGSGPQTQSFDMSAGFHLYAAIWTPDSIQFLIDNNVYYTVPLNRNFWSGKGTNPYTANGQPFDQYFYLIINLAIGGGFFGDQSQALTVQQAQGWANPTLAVDYARVYQLSSAPINVNPSPVAPQLTSSIAAVVTSAAAAVTSAAAAPAGNGGCAAGACGAASCCNDQRNGQQCYSTSQYTCALDSFTQLYGLCYGVGSAVCKGSCYNPSLYRCVNGGLIAGAAAAVTPATTSATPAATPTSSQAATSATPKSSSTIAQATPTSASSNSNGCPNGYCGGGSCCNDGRTGPVCYSTSSFSCLQDTNGKSYLCGLNTGICATNCFDNKNYVCVNGQLRPK